MPQIVKIRSGDFVQVKNPLEILETLDEDGTLGRLPFMPEMMEFCGRRFRVAQRALKTCCYVKRSNMREFNADDVIVLMGLRCSGEAHDGCQKSCTIFWREAWVRKVHDPGVQPIPVLKGREELRARLKTVNTWQAYFCQASEVLNATTPLSGQQRIAISLREIKVGNCTAAEMGIRIVTWIYWKVGHRLFGPYGRGTGMPVANQALNLQAGELVEIKPMRKIKETLNRSSYNRGLFFMPDMRRSCGEPGRVNQNVTKIILDGTGEMRTLRDTVFLEGSLCGCACVAFGGCPRAEFAYWREDWLRRRAS